MSLIIEIRVRNDYYNTNLMESIPIGVFKNMIKNPEYILNLINDVEDKLKLPPYTPPPNESMPMYFPAP